MNHSRDIHNSIGTDCYLYQEEVTEQIHGCTPHVEISGIGLKIGLWLVAYKIDMLVGNC